MRVVHISTSDCQGGAARAAFRLHKGLRDAGHESVMLVHRKASNDPSVEVIPFKGTEEALPWSLAQRQIIDENRTPDWNTYFSLGEPGCDLSAHPSINNADIIHLHWVAAFQSAKSVARLASLGKPVVWTLHDQRPFTGGCHFSNSCRRYETDCGNCPQLRDHSFRLTEKNLAESIELLATANLTIVSPSRWLGECAARSAVFRNSRIEVIPYGIELDIFHPIPRPQAKKQMGLDENAFHILFGADYGAEIRKGFKQLIRALSLCAFNPAFIEAVRRKEVEFVCFGRPEPHLASLDIPIRQLGYLTSDLEMARAYSAADVFIVPTLEDNLPNTILESMACGTPVIATEVGGVPDMLEDGAGFLVPSRDPQALAERIVATTQDHSSLGNIAALARQRVTEKFSSDVQANSMLRLYNQLLNPAGSSDQIVHSSAGPIPSSRAAFKEKDCETQLDSLRLILMLSNTKEAQDCALLRRPLLNKISSHALPMGVVIPTRNSMPYLQAHLQAINLWAPLVEEIVVVDSFSTDGTPDFIRANLSHPRLQILSHPPGLYESWNFGISQLRAKYTYVATVGDLISRAGIEHLVETAEHLQCDVLSSPPSFVDPSGERLAQQRWPIHDIIDTLAIVAPRIIPRLEAVRFAFKSGLSSILGSSASNLYRTEVLQKHPFPTGFATIGDTAWGILNAAEIKFAITPQSCSFFLVHPRTTPDIHFLASRVSALIFSVYEAVMYKHGNSFSTEEKEELLEALLHGSDQLRGHIRYLGKDFDQEDLLEQIKKDYAFYGQTLSTQPVGALAELMNELDQFYRKRRELENLRRSDKFWFVGLSGWKLRYLRNQHRRNVRALKRKLKEGGIPISPRFLNAN